MAGYFSALTGMVAGKLPAGPASYNPGSTDLDPLSTLFAIAYSLDIKDAKVGLVDRRVKVYNPKDQSLARSSDNANRYQVSFFNISLKAGLIPWVQTGNDDIRFFICRALPALVKLQESYKDINDPSEVSTRGALKAQIDILNAHLKTIDLVKSSPEIRNPLHKVWNSPLIKAARILLENRFITTFDVLLDEVRDIMHALPPQQPASEVDKSTYFGLAGAVVMGYLNNEPKKQPRLDSITTLIGLILGNFHADNAKLGFPQGRIKWYPTEDQAEKRTKDRVDSNHIGYIRPLLEYDLEKWMPHRTPAMTSLMEAAIAALIKARSPYLKDCNDEKARTAIENLEGCITYIRNTSQIPIEPYEEIIDRSNPPYCSLELIGALDTLNRCRLRKTLESFCNEQADRFEAQGSVSSQTTASLPVMAFLDEYEQPAAHSTPPTPSSTPVSASSIPAALQPPQPSAAAAAAEPPQQPDQK